ncbi:MAG: hypothetical protein ACRC7O_12215 [Fimbriiglobus sp.]
MDGFAEEFSATQIRATANAPEVHAAAITAAKDFLMARPELPSLTSDTAAATIAMHAAILFRSYLEFVGTDGLVPQSGPGE